MNVFKLRDEVIQQYGEFVRSFVRVRDTRIAQKAVGERVHRIEDDRASRSSKALSIVRSSRWFQEHSVALEEDTRALDGADDFDAAFSALAPLRLKLAGSSLNGSAYEDSRRAGGVLGIKHALLRRADSAGPPRVPA